MTHEMLPPLREELMVLKGPFQMDGSPTWTLHDPIRHRFFRLGWIEHTILSCWNQKSQLVIDQVKLDTGLNVTHQRLFEIVRFLIQNDLFQSNTSESVQRMMDRHHYAKPTFIKQLLSHYLFVRIPLFKPDRFLKKTLPWVEIFYARTFWMVLGVIGFLGLYLTLRQWDSFTHALVAFLNWQGVLWSVGAIFLAKVIHELGHAYTARRYGCSVPTIGVAFLVLWPVLYTDTTSAWRLTKQKQKMAIAGGGMIAELGLAVLALFVWHFLPEGGLRSSVVLLATVTWISTLMINLNPLMRFDGYYLLADFLGMDNLQDRSFALGRWWMRERLFGFGDPPTERFPVWQRRTLLLFSYATWIYRLFLFIGISLMVYHLFFKLAGLLLMAVELGWFVSRPVWREINDWWRHRTRFCWNFNTIVTLGVVSGLFALAIIPWQGSIEVPALLRANSHVFLYPPIPSRVVEVFVHQDQSVMSGDRLIRLESPELDYRLSLIQLQIKTLTWELEHAQTRLDVLQMQGVLSEELMKSLAEKQGYEQQKKRLLITAPFNGVVVGLMDGLFPGEWHAQTTPLMALVERSPPSIEAMIPERDIERINDQTKAVFLSDLPGLKPLSVRLIHKDLTALTSLDEPYFSATYGGPITVRGESSGKPVPMQAFYRLIFKPDITTTPLRTEPGVLRIQGDKESWISKVWTLIATVLIRESGF